jgi:tRNA(fMet)-specific endonuclease VapC
MICLDTNIVIRLLKRQMSPERERLRAERSKGETVAISVIALHELWYGASKSTQFERNEARILGFMSAPFSILPFDQDDAREAGDIRAELELRGEPIGAYDILIAAQARRRDALLVTANVREFARVPRLKMEDWSVP